MILNYRDKKTEGFAGGEFIRAFQGFEDQAAKRLAILNAAPDLATLQALPSNRLEALEGDRAEQFSIRINRQWRMGTSKNVAIRPDAVRISGVGGDDRGC